MCIANAFFSTASGSRELKDAFLKDASKSYHVGLASYLMR